MCPFTNRVKVGSKHVRKSRRMGNENPLSACLSFCSRRNGNRFEFLFSAAASLSLKFFLLLPFLLLDDNTSRGTKSKRKDCERSFCVTSVKVSQFSSFVFLRRLPHPLTMSQFSARKKKNIETPKEPFRHTIQNRNTQRE